MESVVHKISHFLGSFQRPVSNVSKYLELEMELDFVPKSGIRCILGF